MRRRSFLKLAAAAIAARAIPARAAAQAGIMSPVLKRGYDNLNSGANLSETVLTQSSVKVSGIRRYFNLPMEGDRVGAEAQILIAPNVTVDDGTTRDIAVVASMNNTVWAYDANSSDDLWMKKLSVPVQGTRNIDAYAINDHWGVLSTPVIDLDAKRIYLVAWTDPNGNFATAYWQMHVLNLKDGSRVCPPINVEGTSNGQTWNTMMRKQRSSLLMGTFNGKKTVFFASGTVQETSSGAAGWIFAFDVASNKFTTALALTDGDGAGIWMAGASMVADSNYLYAMTGNGGFNGVNAFGECVVKIQYTGTALKVVDWWAPYSDAGREGLPVTTSTAQSIENFRANAVRASTRSIPNKLAGQNGPTMDENLPVNAHAMVMNAVGAAVPKAGWSDEDLGSAGMLMVGNALIAAGKDGIVYVVNAQNMGKTMPADFATASANYAKLLSPPEWFTWFPGYGTNAAPQDPTQLDQLWGNKTRHMHSTPVFFNSPKNGPTVFCGGENSPVRAWSLANGTLNYLAQSNEAASANVVNSPGGMAGSFMCLSANGSLAGTAVLWVCMPYGDANKTVTNGRLLAYDPENFVGGVMQVLWDSQAQGVQFLYNKFCPPTVSGGKLFVPTYGDGYDVYGLAR